ncbi:hypothetical protein SAMN05421630_11567 [Prauserella marina]|uniref:Uncharacterized protein n=2 Tax=Prauserella marina TaxID=530584 RepID=A0A1G6Z1G0_9PSEU|nr:hypothetical protein DES30_11245 [Prauserella marina]SDD96438.1 hypothetical protein SAMN05421630_11567 [Prauserella marina]
MDLTITPPEGYRKTRMPWLWALASCDVCGGSGEYLVDDHDDRDEPWDPEDGPLLYPQPCDCLWAPEPEVTRTIEEQNRREREREQQRQRDARAWAEIDAAIGPRRAGGTYWDGARQGWYFVEAIYTAGRPTDRPAWWIGVRWADGTRSTHSTPWNPQAGDGQPPPPGPAPEPPELRHRRTHCRRCTSRFALVRAAHRIGLL